MAWTENTVELIARRPLFGHGTGSFRTAYGELVRGRPGLYGRRTHDPHNQYLNIASELGLVGLAVFLAILVAAFRRPCPPPWRLLALGVLASWCTTSLFSSHFSTFNEGRFVWLWLGALLAHGPRQA
jgi:O-antigen ligase